MREVMIATQNMGKLKEFEHILKPLGFSVISMRELPMKLDIIEDGQTFEENALIKARAISAHYEGMIIADDSGLEVDALDQKPGVYSARYAGEDQDDEANIDKVLHELRHVSESNRTARFVCALAMIRPNQKEIVTRGVCEGIITTKRQGEQGFGYDPIFYVSSHAKTMAQLSKDEKNAISHRGHALENLVQMLKDSN